jgi:hypothetical protein
MFETLLDSMTPVIETMAHNLSIELRHPITYNEHTKCLVWDDLTKRSTVLTETATGNIRFVSPRLAVFEHLNGSAYMEDQRFDRICGCETCVAPWHRR